MDWNELSHCWFWWSNLHCHSFLIHGFSNINIPAYLIQYYCREFTGPHTYIYIYIYTANDTRYYHCNAMYKVQLGQLEYWDLKEWYILHANLLDAECACRNRKAYVIHHPTYSLSLFGGCTVTGKGILECSLVTPFAGIQPHPLTLCTYY